MVGLNCIIFIDIYFSGVVELKFDGYINICGINVLGKMIL